MRLWHPKGVAVELPALADFDYKAAFAAVDRALAAGFLAAAPGLEAGEEREEVGYVLLRTKVNADKSETKVIDLYSAGTALKYKLISYYLDTPEDAASFEAASGVRVAALREFPGSTSPKRGDNPKSDAFIVRVPTPFGVVLAPNPKYNPDETDPTKKKPEHVFVRWAATAPAPKADPAGPPRADDEAARERAKADQIARARIATSETVVVLTAVWKDTPPDVRERLKDAFTRRREEIEAAAAPPADPPAAPDRKYLGDRVVAAAVALKTSVAGLILKFAVGLKLPDGRPVPNHTSGLTDDQLVLLCRLAENAVQVQTVGR